MTLEQKLVFDLPCWDNLSSSVKELITALLQKDPKQRISLDEALQHPWFKRVRRQKRAEASNKT